MVGAACCAEQPQLLHHRTAGRRARGGCRGTSWSATPAPGDPADALSRLDEFAYRKSFLVSVGDEKGVLLTPPFAAPIRGWPWNWAPYCGCWALRIAVAAPAATVVSVELSEANAAVARRIWDPPASATGSPAWSGTIGDGGRTLDRLQSEHGCRTRCRGPVVHRPRQELLSRRPAGILGRGWLHPGSIVVADNVGIPGAQYRRYMAESRADWRTVEHRAHVEYQSCCATWCSSRSACPLRALIVAEDKAAPVARMPSGMYPPATLRSTYCRMPPLR